MSGSTPLLMKRVPNTIPEVGDYHTETYQTNIEQPSGFTGPEPIIRTEQQFDQHIQKRYNYSNVVERVERQSTGIKQRSALLCPVKPSRFEMPNHLSYHGILDSKEAERKLVTKTESGCSSYLTRYSQTWKSYVLSAIIWHNGIQEPVHIKLNINTEVGTYCLEGAEKYFQKIDDLLSYYENNPLSPGIRSIGSACRPHDDYQHTSRIRPQTTGMTIETPYLMQPSVGSATSGVTTDSNQQFVKKMQDDFHKKLEEERELFKEQIKQMHKDLLEEHKKAEDKAEEIPAQAQNTLAEPQNKMPEEKRKKDGNCTLL